MKVLERIVPLRKPGDTSRNEDVEEIVNGMTGESEPEPNNYPVAEAFYHVFIRLNMHTVVDYYTNPPFPDFDKFSAMFAKQRGFRIHTQLKI